MMLERPDGLMVTGDPLHQLHVGRIIDFLANNRLPGLFTSSSQIRVAGRNAVDVDARLRSPADGTRAKAAKQATREIPIVAAVFTAFTRLAYRP
jgi:hypothetical protein